MNVVSFDWFSAVSGGVLIGLAAVMMMATIGRIAGISGIVAHVLKPRSAFSWQWAFLAGLVLSGLLIHWCYKAIPLVIQTPPSLLVLAGLLVGFGTRLGSGCTSGHGVCGVSRLSPRSIVATITFILVGIITVLLLRALVVWGDF